jgi:hypothetical protein
MAKSKIGKFISIGIFILLGIYLYWRVQDRKEKLTVEETFYTVGKITGYEYGAKVSPWWNFEFYDGRELRQAKSSIDNSLSGKPSAEWKKYVGNKFFVKYNALKPKYNEIYLNKPAPDSLIICDKCKFDKIPTD